MHPVLKGNGEIDLLSNNDKIVAFDGLEQWQIDQLVNPVASEVSSYSGNCLQTIDRIILDWMKGLTKDDWAKIKRQKSLFGIKLPDKWVSVWRFILKEPSLRDADRASRNGCSIGTYNHLWNIWSEDCLDKYLDDIDKDLLQMADAGYLHSEIGEILLGRYGDKFWKPRKENTKTTPTQVVNNYLYWKMPNKIARQELADMILYKLNNKKNGGK